MPIIIVVMIVCFDFISKYTIKKSLKHGEVKEILPDRIYLDKSENTGAALRFLGDNPEAVKKLTFSSVLVSFLLFINSLRKNCQTAKTGYAFLFGGGLANFIDRVKNGHVLDFIAIKTKMKNNKQIFINIADVFILLGSIIILLSSLGKKRS